MVYMLYHSQKLEMYLVTVRAYIRMSNSKVLETEMVIRVKNMIESVVGVVSSKLSIGPKLSLEPMILKRVNWSHFGYTIRDAIRVGINVSIIQFGRDKLNL